MKSIFTASLLFVSSSLSAIAQPAISPAYIQQVTPSVGSFRIATSELIQPIVQMVAQMPSPPTAGLGNLGLVWQQGVGNQATVNQYGGRNVGLIQQIGLDNVASITQRGTAHQAMVSQQGRNNVAIIRQR